MLKRGGLMPKTLLAAILLPVNGESGLKHQEIFTFKSFLEEAYLAIYRQKSKVSIRWKPKSIDCKLISFEA